MTRSRVVADVDLTSEAPHPRGRTRPQIESPHPLPPPPPLPPTLDPVPSDWTDEIPEGGRIWPQCLDPATAAARDKIRGKLVSWGFALLIFTVAATFAGVFFNHAEPSLQVLSEVIPLLAAMVVAESRFFFPPTSGSTPAHVLVSPPGPGKLQQERGGGRKVLGAIAVAGAVTVSAVVLTRRSRKGSVGLRTWRAFS